MAWIGSTSLPVGAAAVVTTISGQPSWYASIPAAMSNSTTSRPSAKRNVRSGRMSAPPQWVRSCASRRWPSYSSGGAPLPARSTIQWPLCMKCRVSVIVEACRAASNTRYVFGNAAWSVPLSKSSIHELAVECAVLTPATSGKHQAGGPAGIAPSGGPPGSQGPIEKRADPASVSPPMSCVGAGARRCAGGPANGSGVAAHDAAMSAANGSARARIATECMKAMRRIGGMTIGVRSFARGLVAVFIFAACQGSTPPPTATPTQVVLPASPSAAPTPSPTPKAPLGGTLRVALAEPIGSVDPQFADANPLLIGQVFEGLVARGASGGTPALGTKWLVAPDGVTWTFTLRAGVTFHDGTPFDAAAAAKSLLTGKKPFLTSTVSGADALTLTLVTSAPDGRFLSALATPAFAIVSPASRVSGTGPFRVPTGGENARPLTLERDERYWRAAASRPEVAYLDKLVFNAVPDPGTRLASIRAGNVDLVQDLAIADAGTVRTDPSLQVAGRPASMVLYLALNLSLAPMDDLRVRQAIALAASGRNIADRSYAGLATAATQLPPPAMLGYDDSVTEFAT